MWGTIEVLERLERLSGRFRDMDEFVAKELQRQRNKVAMLEKEVVELKWVKHRVKTLDSQVNDLMNREEEWKRRLAKIETGLIVDQMKVDGVWKEVEEDWNKLPRVGDLVVNIEQENDIRRVFENNYGFMFVGKEYRTVYARNQLKDSLKEWKVIARKDELKGKGC